MLILALKYFNWITWKSKTKNWRKTPRIYWLYGMTEEIVIKKKDLVPFKQWISTTIILRHNGYVLF